MPLFRREHESANGRTHVLTINGRPQSTPETLGTVRRYNRLFVECERRLADDPLTSESGCLLAPGGELERLISKCVPLFERESSLIRWVAILGAFGQLYRFIFDPDATPTRATALPVDLALVMGLDWKLAAGWQSGSRFPPVIAVDVPPYGMSKDLLEAALAVADTSIAFATDYPRIDALKVGEEFADARCKTLDDRMALACIVWSAAASLRLGLAQPLLEKVPEPDALLEPGWYTDPLYAKPDRYWDGNDWTPRCRMRIDGKLIQNDIPLR